MSELHSLNVSSRDFAFVMEVELLYIYFRPTYLYIPGMFSNVKNDYVQILELTEVIHFNLIVLRERKSTSLGILPR